MEKGLYIVSTPIGNLGDMTARGCEVLSAATVLACEDTRTTQKLLSLLGIHYSAKMIAYHEHNADAVRPKIVHLLEQGETVALVSDAGTPLLSDPGYRLVREVLDKDISVFPIVGANALLPALQLSGLPTDKFLFMGFLPTKSGARQTALREIAGVPATLVFYESPHRIKESLTDMLAVLGDRAVAVVRELTKKFEQSKRGKLSELIPAYDTEPKGEIVIVVDRGSLAPINADDLLKTALKTQRVKEAVDNVAAQTGLSKKSLYQRALELKDEK